MLPWHIIACILVFFFLEVVQLQQRQLLLLLCQGRLHLVRLQLVLEYHNRFVRRRRRRPHPYLELLGHIILGLKFIFIGVISPKNSFFFSFLIDIFLQIMACKLTNLSDFTPDKNLSCSEAGRRRLRSLVSLAKIW